MIKNLEFVKFDFCFYTIEDYNVYIYANKNFDEDNVNDWLQADNEFDTFWININ